MDIRPFHEDAEEIADYGEIVGKFFDLKNKDPRSMATREFFKNEVDILGAFSNECLIQDQGILTEVIVGQWKTHPESELYVRADTYAGIALDQKSIGRFANWYYEWRPDTKETGFFHTTRGGGIALNEIPRAREIINRFNSALEGYRLIAKSTKPLPELAATS